VVYYKSRQKQTAKIKNHIVWLRKSGVLLW